MEDKDIAHVSIAIDEPTFHQMRFLEKNKGVR